MFVCKCTCMGVHMCAYSCSGHRPSVLSHILPPTLFVYLFIYFRTILPLMETLLVGYASLWVSSLVPLSFCLPSAVIGIYVRLQEFQFKSSCFYNSIFSIELSPRSGRINSYHTYFLVIKFCLYFTLGL